MTDWKLRFRPPIPDDSFVDVFGIAHPRGVSRDGTAPTIGVRHDPGDAGASGPGRRTPA